MYEELIERLYAHCNTDQSDAITNEAADALVALQTENGSKDKEIAKLPVFGVRRKSAVEGRRWNWRRVS